MGLANEAAYLYRYSKELQGLNKKIHKISTKVKEKDDKHSQELKNLVKEHKELINKLRYHFHRFYKTLHHS